MDLLGTEGAQSQQQHQQPQAAMSGDCFGGVSEKPGTAASDAMSRPSLISSLWSIQVQNEGSASDFPMMEGCGSQQSLPEMVASGGGGPVTFQVCNGFSGTEPQLQTDLSGVPMDLHNHRVVCAGCVAASTNTAALCSSSSLRPVKSLSDLHTLTSAQIAQTASVMPCHHYQQQQQNIAAGPSDQSSYTGFRRQTETGTYYNMLSRQQRDSQICEWLQKLNVSGGGAETSGSESPSQEFYHHHHQQQQQQHPHRPHFQRADTTDQ